ncbi:MAG: tetratricopeptide repeat protein [Anaerolineae bacterium]|nr:tetratricopeptide repeat protein [Anaerolineae bacterium]
MSLHSFERHISQRISSTIDRPRLLEKMQGVLEHKLTLISAPPGYGKTTLAAQFARQSPYPVAWHTIEERERDVPNLYARAKAVLESVIPEMAALPVASGYTSGELAGFIVEHLREKVQGDLIYILDDVQHLTGSPPAETWLRTLVSLLPSNCHLILITRTLPDLPMAELIARREVLAIGQDELRLTTRETSDLAREIVGAAVEPDRVQELVSRLEGWPAGTVLALHPLPADLERAMLGGGQGPEALFDALARPMLQTQPPSIREFLLASSTLSRLTPELCYIALELPDGASRLMEVQARNLFLVRVSGGLTYHTLFRSFLQKQLKANDPGLFEHLHLKAAHWFEERDDLDEAFDHYVAAEHFEQAAAIAERVAQSYFAQGKVETLLNWSEKLSRSYYPSPRLLYACGIIHADRYEYTAAEDELQAAAICFQTQQDAVGMGDVTIQQALIKLQRGKYNEAIEQVAPLVDGSHMEANLHGRALKILGVARLRLGQVEAAVMDLMAAIPMYRADGDMYALANVLQDLSVAYTRLGRLDEAGACLQEVVALRRELGHSSALALALNNLGYYYHQHSNYAQAKDTFEEGLSVVSRIPARRAESYLRWSLADVQRDRGAFDEALPLYRKALELMNNSEPSLQCAVLVNFSIMRRWQGNLYEAILYAEEAAYTAQSNSIALEGLTANAALWAARALLNRADEALLNLDTITSRLREQGAQYELMRVTVLCAHAALLCSDRQTAECYMESAAEIAQKIGSAQPLAAEISHIPALQSLLREQNAKHELVQNDLKRLRDAQVKAGVHIHSNSSDAVGDTYSLNVYTLGQEAIERNGEPVSSSEWRAIGAKDLFFYLLFKGPVHRDQIYLTFWPNASSKQARSNFHMTLYRARQALGANVITFQDDLYQINPDVAVWSDADALENLARQARMLARRDPRAEDLWRRAVKLYQGEFLLSMYSEWVVPRREALHDVYVEALIGLGECACARHDYPEAIRIFERAVGAEPYREDIHRALMTTYADKGDKRKIQVHFQEMRKLFRRELGIEPSGQTIALVESLLK